MMKRSTFYIGAIMELISGIITKNPTFFYIAIALFWLPWFDKMQEVLEKILKEILSEENLKE